MAEKLAEDRAQLLRKLARSTPVDPSTYGIKLQESEQKKASVDHTLSPYKPATVGSVRTMVENKRIPEHKPVKLQESNLYNVPEKVFAVVEYGTAKKQLGEKEGRVLRMIQEGTMLHITLELAE
jgi:hypothetical protein